MTRGPASLNFSGRRSCHTFGCSMTWSSTEINFALAGSIYNPSQFIRCVVNYLWVGRSRQGLSRSCKLLPDRGLGHDVVDLQLDELVIAVPELPEDLVGVFGE